MDRVVGVAGSTFFDPDKDRMSIVYGRIYTAPKVHSLDLYTTGNLQHSTMNIRFHLV
jgi:outer membrane receptor for ferric coprogen and ferric-rhodotorulic acid